MNAELQQWIKEFESFINDRFKTDLKVVAIQKVKSDKVEAIALIVESVTGITVDDMKGKSRDKFIVSARHISMYLCFTHTKAYTTSIGRFFNRDHTTVLHAIKTIADRITSKDLLTVRTLPECIEKVVKTLNNENKD